MKNNKTINLKENRKHKVLYISMILVVLLIFALLTMYVGVPLVKQLQQSPEAFQEYVSEHRITGSLLMMGMIMLQVIVAFIPGEPFELCAGFVFGWFPGTILCLAGSVLASALVFFAVRKWGIKIVGAFFSEEKISKFSFLKNEKKLNKIIFILFLVPGTPKDLLTYIVGLTPMKLSSFLILSTLARIPSVISSTITGDLTQTGNYLFAVIVYGAVFVISAIWIILSRKRENLQIVNV